MFMLKRVMVLLISILLISLCSITFPIENCSASEITTYVDDSNIYGPWNGTEEFPYQTIQEGIDNTDSGGTVYIYSGTYNENIVITEDLTLIGENKDTTIIDGETSNHVVDIHGSVDLKIEVHISGFTVKNAIGIGNDCIALSRVENGVLNNNSITNSDLSDGIQLDHCNDITISNNEISNNEVAGISLTLSDNCVIHGNVIQNNQKGIYIYYSSNSNDIYNNKLLDNSQFGIHILQSLENRLYLNKFINNDRNAYDSGTNHWNNSNQGNYWDDYSGVDLNPQDGVGDTPYSIAGGNNLDNFPLGYFGPIAEIISISPNPAVQGESIFFDGYSVDTDGNIEIREWSSNIDGDISHSEDFSSSSLSVGTHIIKFRVKDDDDKWSPYDQETLVVNSEDSQTNQKPSAIIENITPNPAYYGETVYFAGMGLDKDGIITAWKWSSNIDGELSTEESFEISDLSAGIHTISFQVKDDDNEWSYQNRATLSVNQNSSSMIGDPVANAGGPYVGLTNEQITFNASGSYDNGTIIEYLWDFGDGYFGAGEFLTHIYTNSGNYTIILTVTDNEGSNATDITYIIITQSSGQSGNSQGAGGFQIELPFPVAIAIELIFIIAMIGLFLFWIKRK